jgi:PAS domain S-box-containing protein
MNFQRLYTPPTFGDEDKDFLARILHIILLAFLAILVFLTILIFVIGQYNFAPILGLLFIINLPTFWLLHRGYLKLTSIWALLNILGAASYFMYIGKGLQDVALLAFPIIIIVSSLILDRRTYAFIVGMSLVLLGLITYDQLLSLFHFPELVANLYIDFAVVAAFLIVTAVVMYVITDNMQNNLIRVRNELAERKLAEEALRLSEIEYRSLFENVPDGIYRTKPDGQILSANPALVQMFGYDTEDELKLAGGVENLYLDPAEREKSLQKLEKDGEIHNSEISLKRRDGSLMFLLENALAIKNDEGRIIYYEGVLTDITERKQAEEAERDQRTLAEALRETAETLSRTLDFGSVLEQILNIAGRVVPHESATIMLIKDGKLHLAGSQGYQERGSSPEKIMGELNLQDPGNLRQIFESHQPVLIPDVSAYPNWKPLPGTEWLRSSVGAPLLLQDNVIGFLLLDSGTPGFFTPLHAQRLQAFADQAAIAVQNSRLFEAATRQLEELSALHRVALAGIQATNVDELIERVTQTIGDAFFPDHFGVILLDESENVLRPHSSYRGLPSSGTPKSFPPTLGVAGRVASSGQPKRIGDIRLDPDYFQATSETLSELCVPIHLGERVIGVLNAESHQLDFFTEEDERLLVTIAGQAAVAIDNFNLLKRLQSSNLELERRVEERTSELNRINVELKHANRAKDEFLATMSHELRTPLNSVLGFSESLLEQRRGPLNEKQEQYVGLIHSSGQHLLDLINDILQVSKIEAGMLELHPDTISVKEICESSLYFIKEMAAKKSISVEFKNENSIPMLYADPQRLKQILVNLLNNAVKFTPEKGKVSLEVHRNDERDQIQFSVTDNGIGIARENLPKLFIPFSQIDSSLSRQYEGTGLGLALVLKLTELHGGSVMVESEPGMGSRFTINLPWSEEKSIEPEQDAELVSPITVVEEPVVIDGQPAKILLAEDNMSNVLTIQEYLSDHGYDVIVAHDGAEAIAMAEESSPNIILMDIHMPQMDGLEAIRRLRATPKFASVPIIALTALAMPGDRERCLEAGANEYLSKPVSLKGLVKTINSLLQNNSDE